MKINLYNWDIVRVGFFSGLQLYSLVCFLRAQQLLVTRGIDQNCLKSECSCEFGGGYPRVSNPESEVRSPSPSSSCDIGTFSGISVRLSAGQIQLPMKVLLVYADLSEDDKAEVLKGERTCPGLPTVSIHGDTYFKVSFYLMCHLLNCTVRLWKMTVTRIFFWLGRDVRDLSFLH